MQKEYNFTGDKMKKLISIFLAGIMAVMIILPAYAATKTYTFRFAGRTWTYTIHYGNKTNTTQKQTTTRKQTTTKKQTTTAQNNSGASTSGYNLNEYEIEVVNLINNVRAKYGLKALTTNVSLSKVARLKSEDMLNKNYFSHTSPTYGSPFDMMKSFGITYRYAGENIAYGQRSPQEVVNAWMNSSGHRANILNANFTQIGMGYVSNGNYWTQMFIG